MDLDWPVPHAGSTEEGIDLDLVKFINLALADCLVRLVDQSLDTGSELGQQRLSPGVWQAAQQGYSCQVLPPQVLRPAGELQPRGGLGGVGIQDGYLAVSLLCGDLPLLQCLVNAGADQLCRVLGGLHGITLLAAPCRHSLGYLKEMTPSPGGIEPLAGDRAAC